MFEIVDRRRGMCGLPQKLYMFTTVNRGVYGGSWWMYASVCSCFALVGCVCKLDCGDGGLGMFKTVGLRWGGCGLP